MTYIGSIYFLSETVAQPFSLSLLAEPKTTLSWIRAKKVKSIFSFGLSCG